MRTQKICTVCHKPIPLWFHQKRQKHPDCVDPFDRVKKYFRRKIVKRAQEHFGWDSAEMRYDPDSQAIVFKGTKNGEEREQRFHYTNLKFLETLITN